MRKTLIAAFVVAASLSLRCLAAGGECVYGLSSGSVHVEWRAYKTTKRVGVSGEFKAFEVSAPKPGRDLAKLLDKTRIVIDPLSGDTGNPARDLTLNRFFFSAIKPAKIEGSVSRAKGSETGSFDLVLRLNGSKKTVPMRYELADDGSFAARGNINVLSFGLSPALDALHKACFEKHKGADGVSKTWPDVDLKITAKIDKTCR